MYQSFDVSSRPEQGPPRLASLRNQIANQGLAGFLIPRADMFQGEYVAACDDRLAWLTGFTGSAGFACVLSDIAGVFIDGRYRVQVQSQIDLSAFTPVHWPEVKIGDWLKEQLLDGGEIGFDPWLHTIGEIKTLRKSLQGSGLSLRACANLVDAIWADRPAPPMAPISAYPAQNAGEPHEEKRARLAADLRENGHGAAVITLPDSVAWLLNIRGADIPRNPVAHAMAVLTDDGKVQLFCAPGKADGIADHLGPDVAVLPIEAFAAALAGITGPVLLDRASAPWALRVILKQAGSKISYGGDPCALPKARKNAVELAGARAAHLRDGAAMVEFLTWLDGQKPGQFSEIDTVKALEGFRRDTEALREISFETIAGAGPNGAIVHYRVNTQSNRTVEAGQLLLIDSGGQYIDGTTDITRTVPIGPVGAEERACFTRVLQGMIAISQARFPRGVAGQHLDALARAPLWMAGMDYDHGTGHGVGAYLCVHEGPQRISRLSDVALAPGMILSNEPGYYREGAFGIRIENLIAVCEAPPVAGGDNRDMLGFETLTYVPIDRRLIAVEMLSPGERDWLNAYHAQVRAHLQSRLSAPARAWLLAATAPI
ncbi:MAG: aminopeptidase P family protein [Paracoccaceae bacterium]